MATKEKAQISMDDTIVDDPDLEKLLEERQELKVHVSEYRKTDKAAKDKIRSIETPSPYRVGRFVITKLTTESKQVSFESLGGIRFNIKAIGEE